MTTAVVDNKVKQIISNIRNLPTPPIVFHQIQKVINDPNVSAGQIASVLSEDPAMSVKVLKLTNSAFYGLAREVESVKQAVVIVGLEAIKNLVLSASVLDMFKGEDFDHDFQERFWRHSLAVGFCGRIVARKARAKGVVDPDAAFSSGLLHDIGKMILSCFLKEEYKKFTEARAADKSSLDMIVEQNVLGYDHSQIGATLAEQWKLPQRLAEAIAYHHNPLDCPGDDLIAHVVHISDYISKKTFYDGDEQYLVGDVSQEILDFMQVERAQLDEFGELLREEYLKAETFMKMAGIS